MKSILYARTWGGGCAKGNVGKVAAAPWTSENECPRAPRFLQNAILGLKAITTWSHNWRALPGIV